MHRNNEIRKARRGTATGHAKIQTSLNEMVGGVRAAITTTAAALVNPSCAAAECALSLSLCTAPQVHHQSTYILCDGIIKVREELVLLYWCTILLYLFEIARAHTTYSISMCTLYSLDAVVFVVVFVSCLSSLISIVRCCFFLPL